MVNNDLVLVIAGHYCVSADYSELSHQAESEINSLVLGIDQYQDHLQRGNLVKLVIWVNDIGITPMEREQYQQTYQLPDNYAALIKQANIALESVIIRFESQARNRASKLVRQLKRLHPHLISELSASEAELVRCVDYEICPADEPTKTVLTIKNAKGLPLVIKEGGAAKCCAILATFFSELEIQFKPVKMIAVFNFLYTERIKAGMYVAQTLLDFNTPVSCIFCDERQQISSELFITTHEISKKVLQNVS